MNISQEMTSWLKVNKATMSILIKTNCLIWISALFESLTVCVVRPEEAFLDILFAQWNEPGDSRHPNEYPSSYTSTGLIFIGFEKSCLLQNCSTQSIFLLIQMKSMWHDKGFELQIVSKETGICIWTIEKSLNTHQQLILLFFFFVFTFWILGLQIMCKECVISQSANQR